MGCAAVGVAEIQKALYEPIRSEEPGESDESGRVWRAGSAGAVNGAVKAHLESSVSTVLSN